MAKKEKVPGAVEAVVNGPRVERLTKVQVGDGQFVAHGIARIKSTRDGEPITLEIPIKSIQSSEAEANEWGIERPLPPREKVSIHRTDPLAKKFGMADTGGFVDHVKSEDSEYIKALEKYGTDVSFAAVAAAIDVPLLDVDGNEIPATDIRRRIDAVRNLGFSVFQLQELAQAVRDLTAAKEAEEENF